MLTGYRVKIKWGIKFGDHLAFVFNKSYVQKQIVQETSMMSIFGEHLVFLGNESGFLYEKIGYIQQTVK